MDNFNLFLPTINPDTVPMRETKFSQVRYANILILLVTLSVLSVQKAFLVSGLREDSVSK